MGELTLQLQSPSEPALTGRLSSDERLARLVSRGSARAFATLYRRHHQALYRYCRSIVRDEDDAQDALQSTMMRALVALRAQQRDLAVRPWLFRIAHNEAISVLRRRRPAAVLVEELEPADGGVERVSEERERMAMLLADLRALPVRQRSALVMRELSGLSIEEIAGALCTSPGAAKQAIFEARSALHDFAEGRAMECEQVRQAISDGDRRVLRGRRLRGHLRGCAGCHDFQVAISTRSADLCALVPPLPGIAAAGLLGRLLAHGFGGAHTGGLAAGSGAVVGNSAAASLSVKAIAGVSALTVAVAGGARLALVHSSHRPASGAARQGAGLGSSGLAAAGTMRLDTSAGDTALPATESVVAAGTPAWSSASAAASARRATPPSVLSGVQPGMQPGWSGAKDRSPGYRASHRRGPGGTPAADHRASHRSPAGSAHGRHSGSPRSRHGGAGAAHRQRPVHPARPTSRHGRGGSEPRAPGGGPPAPPAPASTGAQQGPAGARTHVHSASADAPRAGAGGEGHPSSTTLPEGARRG